MGDIIYLMIKHHPKTSEHVSNVNGVNVTKAAELIGLPQPTLKKILDGKTRSLRFETEELFKSFFGVDSSQLKGERPISWISESSDSVVMNFMNANAANGTQDSLAELIKLMAQMSPNEIKSLIEQAEKMANNKQ